jgi:hypothetical protein
VTATVLRFDPTLHEYRTPDGQLVPSVTQILKAVGVAVDFDELRASSARLGAAIDLKREIGTALHADAHAFDDDDLDWSTVDPRVEPYVRAWATFRENTRLVPVTRERRVFHPTLGYAGTLDGIFEQPNGRLVLADIKTGDPTASGCAYQTAAYLAAYRWGVQLTPERRVPYRIFPYEAFDDFAKFQSFVTTYHCQAARRRTAAIV